ncbi:MAG: hypothetical protein GQ565_07140 [Candidatus Aegiribacteria sp.]|nr:hypothetical protein [Candidatus Aegiribacteria sp.]
MFRKTISRILLRKRVKTKSRSTDRSHPWYEGFKFNVVEETDQKTYFTSLPPPILFLSRGHSGTRALSHLLQRAGIYMGNIIDPYCLNQTEDALYWVYGFQRELVPQLFKYGKGCSNIPDLVDSVGKVCISHHMSAYKGGPWGFKTCAGSFSHQLYNYLFPNAKYIYLLRDGRDVILSNNGKFHMAGHSPITTPHWEYFRIITSGISNDFSQWPFQFNHEDEMEQRTWQNRFWIQAKSWREDIRMMEFLKETSQLSDSVYTIKYEELCANPTRSIKDLFNFLNIPINADVVSFASKHFYTTSVSKWKNWKNYVFDTNEDLDKIFDEMKTELILTKYLT